MRSTAPAGDRRSPLGWLAALALGLAVAGGILWWRARDDAGASAEPRPVTAAPAAAARPAAVSQRDGAAERNRRLARAPEGLPSHEAGAKAYADAVAARAPNPGEQAFRADALAYFEHNGDLGEEKANKLGITVDELKELTYMGLLAMQLRRWDQVAQVMQRELTADERSRGDELVFSASNELKAAIRDHVAKGHSAEVRWETIRKHQASFIEGYKAIVRISPDEYDRLLALPFQRSVGG